VQFICYRYSSLEIVLELMQQVFFFNYELINHGVLGNYSDVAGPAGPVANETCRLEAVRCHEILF
jgi:hypothetical protein